MLRHSRSHSVKMSLFECVYVRFVGQQQRCRQPEGAQFHCHRARHRVFAFEQHVTASATSMAAPLVSRASTSLAATACRCSLPAGASLAKSKKQERRSLSTGCGGRPANAQAGPSTRSYASVVKSPVTKPAVCFANCKLVDWKDSPETK